MVRIIRATGGQRLLKQHASNGATVHVKLDFSLAEQGQLKPSEQDQVARERIKAALLEVAAKL